MANQMTLRQPTADEIAQAKLPASYEVAKQAIVACERLDELKDLADKQSALAAYARLAKDDSLRLIALRIQARAERRCGELLKQIPRADSGTRYGQEGAHPPVSRTSAARDAGLSEHQRKTALRIASVSEAEFERAVEGPSPPTVTELARRGTFARPQAEAPVRQADPATVAQAQFALAAFAEFAAEHEPVGIATSISPRDASELRQYISRIDRWLDRFVTALPKGGAAAA